MDENTENDVDDSEISKAIQQELAQLPVILDLLE
jgi:hypothetical protein